jgi:DNA-binding CsgD family transcriptional regulator
VSEREPHYAVNPRTVLTKRQQEVLALIAKGRTNGQIAELLGISIDGAKFHVGEILDRLKLSTREEAALAWKDAHSPRGRLTAFVVSLTATKALGAWAAVAALAVVAGVSWGAFATGGESGTRKDPVTVGDVIKATQKAGQALYIEMSGPSVGEPVTFRTWYASEIAAARFETVANGVTDVTLNLDGRRVSYTPRDNMLSDTPAPPRPAGAPDGAIATFAHVGLLLPPVSGRFVGEEVRQGQHVYRFDAVDTLTRERAGDRVPGTTFRYQLYLRVTDLLPVAITATMEEPGKAVSPIEAPRFVRAEFVDLASLPPGFFDADVLKAEEVTPAESLALAGKQPFVTFWLGATISTLWTHPNGTIYPQQTLIDVRVRGGTALDNPNASFGYGPGPGAGPALLQVSEGPLGSFTGVTESLKQLMAAAGNLHPLAGGRGFTYVLYTPAAQCTPDEAQTREACRQGSATYGAVVELAGTRVHLTAVPVPAQSAIGATNTNPFASEAILADLTGRLSPIP